MKDNSQKRATATTSRAVIEFCGCHETFHTHELHKFVARETGVTTPGTADRILRDLRGQGIIRYAVVDRKQGLYRVLDKETPMQGQSQGEFEYPVHPAAMLFPMMNAKALKELADDIKATRLREPVILYQGKILDGRNRLAACKMAGVSPRYEQADFREGDSLISYVVSLNLKRRHLSDRQRAAIAARLTPMVHIEAETRRKARNASPTPLISATSPTPLISGATSPTPKKGRSLRSNESTSIAAGIMNVGRSAVEQAAAVMKRDSKEFERIMTGETSPGTAYKKVMADAATKRKPLLVGKRHQNFAKRKVVEILSHVRGLCRALAMVNIPAALAALTEAEKKTWTKNAKESMGALREFTGHLEGRNNNDGSNGNDEDHRSGSAQPAGTSEGTEGSCAGQAETTGPGL
jgi:hypothetical protein